MNGPLEGIKRLYSITTAAENLVASPDCQCDVSSASSTRRVFDQSRRAHVGEFVFHIQSIAEVLYVVKG